jgi:hypothetical protein
MARIKTNGAAQMILSYLKASHEWGPFTERQILDQVRPKGCSPRWGNSYFLVGKGNSHEVSLIKRGLIDIVAESTRGARMYAISELGRKVLQASLMIPALLRSAV